MTGKNKVAKSSFDVRPAIGMYSPNPSPAKPRGECEAPAEPRTSGEYPPARGSAGDSPSRDATRLCRERVPRMLTAIACQLPLVVMLSGIQQAHSQAILDNNLNIVDLSNLDGDLPLEVNSTARILWKTEAWENPRWQNPGWPNASGGDSVGFPSVVKNDKGPNADNKYYLFYSHHDPMAGIGLAVADSITGPYIKNNVPGRSDNLVVPSFQYDNANWSPDSPDHYSSPAVVWNEDTQSWHLYFHYFNHIRPGDSDFQLTAVATTSDLASHDWTPLTSANSPTTPNLVPVLSTASFCGTGCGAWNDEASSYNVVARLPAALPETPADQTWLAFIRGTPRATGLPALGFATSSDGINWNHFSENPVIHQPSLGPGGFGAKDGVYRPAFIGYLGLDGNGQHEYLAVWGESNFFDGNVQYIYARTTDFKSFTRDPRGFAQWPGEDGAVSAFRENDTLYLFSKKHVHTMNLSVLGGDFSWTGGNFGDWNSSSNWTPARVPNGPNTTVRFAGGTSTTLVQLNQTKTVRSIQLDGASQYNLFGSGTLQLSTDADDPSLDISDGNHAWLVNVEALADTTIDINSGSSLELNGVFGFDGVTVTKQGGGTLLVDGGSDPGSGSLNLVSGTLGGDGALNGNLISISGAVAPGHGVGQLNVKGDFTLGSSAALQIDIAGAPTSHYDALLVNGNAQLDGMLEVTLNNDYHPEVGRRFLLLTANSIVNDGLVLGGPDAEMFQLILNSNSVVLQTITAGLPGDYNDDGIVNAADYTMWRGNLGRSAGTLPNDVDGGTIGRAQYDTWMANFGLTSDSPSWVENTAVPEPPPALLLILSALTLTFRYWGPSGSPTASHGCSRKSPVRAVKSRRKSAMNLPADSL